MDTTSTQSVSCATAMSRGPCSDGMCVIFSLQHNCHARVIYKSPIQDNRGPNVIYMWHRHTHKPCSSNNKIQSAVIIMRLDRFMEAHTKFMKTITVKSAMIIMRLDRLMEAHTMFMKSITVQYAARPMLRDPCGYRHGSWAQPSLRRRPPFPTLRLDLSFAGRFHTKTTQFPHASGRVELKTPIDLACERFGLSNVVF